jgi:IS30 family transposase
MGRSMYRANEADSQAWESALRPKRCLLASNRKLRRIVASKLILDWSPEQISGWLKIQYLDDKSLRVSHDTVYRSLFIQARGVLKKELFAHLRIKRRTFLLLGRPWRRCHDSVLFALRESVGKGHAF